MTLFNHHSDALTQELRPFSIIKRVPFRLTKTVSRDAHAARDVERMSGQQGVPVIRIDSQVVLGFDRPKIDRLLALN